MRSTGRWLLHHLSEHLAGDHLGESLALLHRVRRAVGLHTEVRTVDLGQDESVTGFEARYPGPVRRVRRIRILDLDLDAVDRPPVGEVVHPLQRLEFVLPELDRGDHRLYDWFFGFVRRVAAVRSNGRHERRLIVRPLVDDLDDLQRIHLGVDSNVIGYDWITHIST